VKWRREIFPAHALTAQPSTGEPLIAFGGFWLPANRAACNQTNIIVCAKDHICPKRTATLSYWIIFARRAFRSQVVCETSLVFEILFQALKRIGWNSPATTQPAPMRPF
jgi:hypothetical protein